MDITNSNDLREKIREIHNFMRNNGIGYDLTSLKTFNLFYGLMKIEQFKLNDKIGLDDEKCKFSYLHKIVNDPNNQNKIIEILDKKTIEMIYTNNEKVNSLLAYNIPLDLKIDVYKHLINEIEKSSNEQLSGKIYEYFVGRDQSANENPNAISILEKNKNKIDWANFSRNPSAISILEKNQDKIKWNFLSENPAIFELDYEKMLENNIKIYEELIKEVMKPSRIFKKRKIYDNDNDNDNEDYYYDNDYMEELFGD